MPKPEQVQLQSPVPGMPGPASSAQVQLGVFGLSTVAMVELSWSHWPFCRVDEVPSAESADSHHQSYHSGRSRPHPSTVHQAAPPLYLQCL